MNKTLAAHGRKLIKEALQGCSKEQQDLFKRLYGRWTELEIVEVVDNMDETKIDYALTQCEKMYKINKLQTDLKEAVEDLQKSHLSN
ncbi:hypothetical protein KTO58_19835 [Chitinophaga pendula]|uniref:hypothetical protein n=1 Tax=Chitinophaga TaxID=79328 RepID=UPI0012FDB989|nr:MULTISPECIES: hypothetical protein [Chitinophaga]UCJ05922.1 hypothetical protein KTO58_19835 [Chitinophaga pendula]